MLIDNGQRYTKINLGCQGVGLYNCKALPFII